MITCDEEYGEQFAAAGLLLSPGIAQMYTTGEIAAEICLETARPRHARHRGVLEGQPDDRLDADDPLQRRARRRLLPRAEPVRRRTTPSRPLRARRSPASTSSALALPWGGTSHPVWFKNDPRVANCKALGGVFNRALMLGVPQIVGAAIEATKDMDRRGEVRRTGRRPPRR